MLAVVRDFDDFAVRLRLWSRCPNLLPRPPSQIPPSKASHLLRLPTTPFYLTLIFSTIVLGMPSSTNAQESRGLEFGPGKLAVTIPLPTVQQPCFQNGVSECAQSILTANVISQATQNHVSTIVLASWIIAGLFIIGLIGAIIWSRLQLRAFNKQLSEEKATRTELDERVNQLNRMESLGMLAGGVAHDFNNLLVGVMCNAELMQKSGNYDDEFSSLRLGQIIASAEKASDLSRQLLSYAGDHKVSRQTTDIRVILEKMQQVLSATAGPGLELIIEPQNKSLFAKVDQTQLEQIILNLVSNARAASTLGSKVVVRSGAETIASVGADPSLQGNRNDGGDFVFVEVQDFGVGFSAEQAEQLFQPFYSSNKKEGYGLGLSVVKGIVNAHDGLIRVSSDNNQGTKFRILLPATHSEPPPEEA